LFYSKYFLFAFLFLFFLSLTTNANAAFCPADQEDIWINSSAPNVAACSTPDGFPPPQPAKPAPDPAPAQKPCEVPADRHESSSISPSNKYKLCCCYKNAPTVSIYHIPPHAYSTALGLVATEAGPMVADALAFLLGIAGGVCLLLLISGGFKYATSHGSPDAVMDAKNTITAALTGLAVIVFAVLILGTLGVNVFGLPGFGWNATNQLITPN